MAEDTATQFEPTDTAAASADAATPQTQAPAQPAKPDAGGFVWGTGRRKTAIARVRLRPGDGKFIINDKRPVEDYFSEPQHVNACHAPLKSTQTEGKLDVYVRVEGGGYTGQAEAVLLGVARALKNHDPSLEEILRDHGYLTRDPRKVERKKYGQPGARRKFQFSKR